MLNPLGQRQLGHNLRILRQDPIFIVGSPRSGTTLLMNMLNRHPSIRLCEESYYFYYVYARHDSFGDLSAPINRRRLVDRYLAIDRINQLGLDHNALSETLMREGDSYKSFFTSLMHFYAMQAGKPRFGDKTPRHAFYSEILCEWYPDCKLILLVRDPRDVVASRLRMPLGSSSVLANARTWLSCTLAAERCSHRDNYLLVRYEQLVNEPEAELKRITAFLGEEYSPAMLVPDEQAKADKWWLQRAHKAVTTERVGKWCDDLTSTQVALIEWAVGSHLRRFGYEPSGLVASVPTIVAGSGHELLASARKKITKLPRTWYYWMQPTQLAAEESWITKRAIFSNPPA